MTRDFVPGPSWFLFIVPRVSNPLTWGRMSSAVKASEKQPICSPAVIVALKCVPSDCPARHLTLVSASQNVVSQLEVGEPKRIVSECTKFPNLDPLMVTLADPVCGKLVFKDELKVALSVDIAFVKLQNDVPDVRTSREDPSLA